MYSNTLFNFFFLSFFKALIVSLIICFTIILLSHLNTKLVFICLLFLSFFSFLSSFSFFFRFLSFFFSFESFSSGISSSFIFKFLDELKPFFNEEFNFNLVEFSFSSELASCKINNLSIAVFLKIVFFVIAKIPLIPFLGFSGLVPSNNCFTIFSKKLLYFSSSLFLKNKIPYPIKSYNLFCKIL